MLEPGATVPDFTLMDQQGTPQRWADFRGKPVAVFFYPKANTPGCTQEACDFRDLRNDFEAAGASIVGISADSIKKQSNFADKHGLEMPLLSDPEHTVLEPWGVWAEKKNYGRTYMGIKRTTVLFDDKGMVAQVWQNVRVKGHADAVLAAVSKLNA